MAGGTCDSIFAPSMGGSGRLLLQSAVTPATKDAYRRAVLCFLLYCAYLALPVMTKEEIDDAFCAFFDECASEELGPSYGDLVICAWCDLWPAHRPGDFVKGWRAVRAWRRLKPPLGRHPLPWMVCAAVAARVAFIASPLHALAIVMMFDAYLRPYELLNIRFQDILHPASGFRHYMLIVCPMTGHRPSKTRVYDDGVAFDSLLRPQLHELLKWLIESKNWQPHDKIFPFTHEELNDTIKAAIEWLHLAAFNFTAYHARHGGPSEDYAFGGRDKLAVQKRGRWMTESSLRRYEQCNRLHVVIGAMPKTLVDFCLCCVAHLVELIVSPRALQRPQVLVPISPPAAVPFIADEI